MTSLNEKKAGSGDVEPLSFNAVVDAVVALQAGGGGSQPGAARVLGPFNITSETPNLLTGVALFQPAVGDLILNWIVDVVTGFETVGNMTAFYAALGDWLDGGIGISKFGGGNPPLYDSATRSGSFTVDNVTNDMTDSASAQILSDTSGYRNPVWLDGAAPLCVKVDNPYLPEDPWAEGEANIYVVVASPALP